MRRLALVVGFAAVALLGVIAGRELRPRTTPHVASPSVEPRLVPYAVGGAWSGPSLEQIRAVVREEMGRASPPKDAPAPTPPSAEAGKARAHLEDVIASGTWRADDRATLLRLLPGLPDDERNELLSQLARAINDGSLRIDPGAMLL